MNGLELFAIAVLVILFCVFIFVITYPTSDVQFAIAVSAIIYAIFLVITVLLLAPGEPFVLGV